MTLLCASSMDALYMGCKWTMRENVLKSLREANSERVPDGSQVAVGHLDELFALPAEQRGGLPEYVAPRSAAGGGPAAGRRRPALNSGRCGSGVRKTLESLRGSCTLIVIAHRLSTIMSADQVLVVDQGRLVERGTPGELLAARGLFAQLYESQVLKAKADTGPEISV